MGTTTTFLRAVLLLGASTLLTGCGAGLITGIAANENSGPTAEVRPPELSITPLLPLAPAANTARSVLVTNAQVSASARLRVTLEAAGVTVDQVNPVISGRGGSTAIDFTLETAAIIVAVGDATAADVAALLTVLVDDVEIAKPVAVTLARQPRMHLDLPLGTKLFLSPLGQQVTLRVSGLQSVVVDNLQMHVETRDPDHAGADGKPAVLTRLCTGLGLVPTGNAGEGTLTATVPGNTFPDRARLFVRDASSGQSTKVEVYYRPEITLALPRQGVTTGGNLVTLIGTALVPHDFAQTPSPLDFDAVELSFEKGGRISSLAAEDFREQLSAGDRLVFRMPPSPDGRPDQVDIVLRFPLEGANVEVTENEVYLFANPNPFFGPRGAVLDQLPVAVAPIALDAAPAGNDAPDFAVLTEEGGVGFLQLLLAQENGMFLRFGARRRIGDHEVAAERNPRDLCTADFDGDQVPDMLLINEGAATATHHIVLGQARPMTPLGALHRLGGSPGMARCFAAKIDGDALADVILIPGPAAPALTKPQVLLARPTAPGEPAFLAPVTLPVRDFAYQATVIADLNGDGFNDIGFVDGVQLKLDVVFGNGDGTFEAPVELDFAVPGYVPDPGSTAIGLHACGNGPLQSLALVLSGDDDGNGADPNPVVATLHQLSPRVFSAPIPGEEQGIGDNPVGVSLVADLDGAHNPAFELVVAVRGDPSPGTLVSMGVFRFFTTRFFPIGLGVEIGGELPRSFRALHFGRAFPATQLSGEARAIFAIHESEVDGVRERRLSTLLIFDTGEIPQLLPPDAGMQNGSAILGIVGGNWSEIAVAGEGRVRDLALAKSGTIELVENDGFGGLPLPSVSLIAPGLLPRSMQLLPGATGQVDRIVYFDGSSRLSAWLPDVAGNNAQFNSSGELRLASPNPVLQTATLDNTTRVQIADVDGDGFDDVVALLRFAVATTGVDTSLLVLMRGKAGPISTELPFYEPTVVTAVHGRATSFTLGDFAATSSGPAQLELALAVPQPVSPGGLDGDHVRFFRYVAGTTPAEDRFEPSALAGGAQVLLAGSRPTQVAADDFDADGIVDLLVAADGDDTLRLFRNVALATTAPGNVNLDAFVEALSSPRTMSPGTPTELRLGDVNGDSSIDAIVVVESVVPGSNNDSTAVTFYLSEEPGVFGDVEFVSPTRLGNRNAKMVLDLGDWNRDNVLDLFLGWNTVGIPDQNVRVLFGGSR